MIIDLDSPISGDVTEHLRPYTGEADRHVVEGFVRLIQSDKSDAIAFDRELRKVGMDQGQYVDFLTVYGSNPLPHAISKR